MKIPIQLTPELQEKVFFPNFHHIIYHYFPLGFEVICSN